MKKILIICILFCVLAGSAFADWWLGGYGTSYWTPYRMTVPTEGDTQHTTAVQTGWGEGDMSAGIYAGGAVEWGGLNLGLGIAGGAGNSPESMVSVKGSGWVWAKPFKGITAMESLTLYLGTPNDDTLQGKIGSSDLVTYVLNDSYRIQGFRLEYGDAHYNTFNRLNPATWGKANGVEQNLYWPRISAGAMLTFKPIENLFIGFFVAPEQWNLTEGSGSWGHLGNVAYPIVSSPNGDSLDGDDGATIDQDFYDARKVYQKMQFAVGYTFAGIGLARVQYLGMRNIIEAAFQVTAFGDMVFDIGFKMPFEGTDKEDYFTYKKKRDYQASLAATFKYYEFNFMGRIDAAFGGSDSSNNEYSGVVMVRGLNIIAYLVPSYKLGDLGTIGLDIGFEYEQADLVNDFTTDQMKMGAALWLSRDLAGVKFKIAAVTRFPFDYGGSYDNGLPAHWTGGKQSFELMFPMIVSVGF
jgi:hypothetical protein